MLKWLYRTFLISLIFSNPARSVWSVPSISEAVLGLGCPKTGCPLILPMGSFQELHSWNQHEKPRKMIYSMPLSEQNQLICHSSWGCIGSSFVVTDYPHLAIGWSMLWGISINCWDTNSTRKVFFDTNYFQSILGLRRFLKSELWVCHHQFW